MSKLTLFALCYSITFLLFVFSVAMLSLTHDGSYMIPIIINGSVSYLTIKIANEVFNE